MVMFFPLEQELDCISSSGNILGKIRFDVFKDEYEFVSADPEIALSDLEEALIVERLSGLASGKYSIPMSDED